MFCAYCIQMQIINCAQTWGSLLISFRALSFQSYHNIYLSFEIFVLSSGYLDLLIACFNCWCFFSIVLQSLDPQYSLISSYYIRHWICAYYFHSYIWEMHTWWRNSHYIDLLILFAHFGTRCQWGRSFRGFNGVGFVLLAFGFVYSGNSTTING